MAEPSKQTGPSVFSSSVHPVVASLATRYCFKNVAIFIATPVYDI